MQKRHVKKLIVLTVAAAGASSMTLFSAGVAGASPDMSGKTYSQAQAALKLAGYTAVASTVIGDKTAQGDCKVISQRDFPSGINNWPTSATINNIFVGGDQPTLYPGPGFGDIPTTGRVMLTLACYPADDASAAYPTGSGDINTKKAH